MPTEYLATIHIEPLTQPYEGRLISPPVVRKRLGDRPGGFVEIQNVSAELANADGKLTSAYLRDLRSRSWVIKHYDVFSGVTTTDFIGQVERDSLGEGVLELDGTNVDLAIFDKEIPGEVIDTNHFPKAVDTGKTIPIVFGNVPKVPLPYIEEDLPTSTFIYAVGEGAISVGQVWRSGGLANPVRVTPAEYYGAAYVSAGKTYLKFALRQTNSSGALHTIYADVVGYQTERNFAYAIKKILTDTEWGLGQTVDVASFDNAAGWLNSDFASPDYLYCDGAITKQMKAQDILQQLLMVRGMRLGMNTSRQWIITVDRPPTGLKMAISSGPGDAVRNLARVSRRTRVAASDRPHLYTFKYRLDMVQGNEHRAEQTRTFGTAGTEIVEQNDFVRVASTADKIADYRAKLLYYGQESIEDAELTQEARTLDLNDVVVFTDPALACQEEIFRVNEVEVGYDSVRAKLVGYHLAVHQYTPGTILVTETDPTGEDYTQTPPGPVQFQSVLYKGTEQGDDGGTLAWVDLQFDVPTTNCVGARIDVRRNGEPYFQQGIALTHSTGLGVIVRVHGRVPNVGYDYQIVALSPFGKTSTPAYIMNSIAERDLTLPPAVTSLSATPGINKTVWVAFAMAYTPDLKGFDWQICTTADFSAGHISFGTSPVNTSQGWTPGFTVSHVSLLTNTNYWIRVVPFDYSANRGPAVIAGPFIFLIPDNPTITGAVYGVDLAQDGTWVGAAHFYITTAAGTNFAYTRLDWKYSGHSVWNEGAMISHTQGNIELRLVGLTSGAVLDFRVVTVNQLGLASAGSLLTAQQMQKDSVAPSVPADLTLSVGTNRTLHFSVSPPPSADRDIKGYEWGVSAGANWSVAAIALGTIGVALNAGGANVAATISHDAFLYDTTYHFQVRAFDHSGNVSGFCASVAFTFSRPGTVTGLYVAGWYVKSAADGTATTDALIGFNGPAGAIEVRCDYWHYGIESWGTPGIASYTTPIGGQGGLGMVIKALVPGIPYAFRFRGLNRLGESGPSSELLPADYGGAVPGDSTAPAVPVSLVAHVANRSVQVYCQPGDTGADTKAFEWQITTGANGTGSVVIEGSWAPSRTGGVSWQNVSLSIGVHLGYGQTGHIRVRAVDFTGNRSGWSASTSFVYTQQATGDIVMNAITQWYYTSSLSGSFAANGTFQSPLWIDLSGVLIQSAVQVAAVITLTNSADGANTRNYEFRIRREYPTLQIFPSQVTNILPAGMEAFILTAYDTFNPGSSGFCRYWIDVKSADNLAANSLYYYAYMQLAEFRR